VKPCKLCGGPTSFEFARNLAHGLRGEYFECRNCHLLQSGHLDHLPLSDLTGFYDEERQSPTDTGAAWRQYSVVTKIRYLARFRLLPSAPMVLDFGCGSGFTVAYLQARYQWPVLGYDSFGGQSYLAPEAVAHDWDTVVRRGPFDLIIASEVLEHLVRPRDELARLRSVLAGDGSAMYVTTGLYVPGKHDATWQYLAPDSGQHVCFYSQTSLKLVGDLLGGCDLYRLGKEYEWLFMRRRKGTARLRHARTRASCRILRWAASLGVIESVN
jgi:SAM-dependent methyltransferase